MKLKSGCMFWPEIDRGLELCFPKMEREGKCEVAIIGGGISGALAAYYLTKEGIDAVMVDRRRVGRGSTSASTGLLQYEIDTHLIELIKKMGRERAVAAYRASLEALRAFGPLVGELGDSCGLTARRSLYLASKEKDVDRLREECSARRSMGIEVEFVEGEKLREELGISRAGALWSREGFEVDPYRLVMRLVGRAVEWGLEVFEETEIVSMERSGGGVRLCAAGGVGLEAKKVVIAMGYETMGLLPGDICQLSSTYAVASEPLGSFEGWPERCLVWESARPYLYVRTTEDGRAIVGGADEEIVEAKKRDALLEKKTEELRRRFGELFPRIEMEPACAWAGTFAETKDGLPYIGMMGRVPDCYFALGYGGNGITFSLLAAEIIRDLFLGRRNEYARLFGFER